MYIHEFVSNSIMGNFRQITWNSLIANLECFTVHGLRTINNSIHPT